MTYIKEVILQLKKELTSTFSSLENWFNKPVEILYYVPQNSGWTIFEILEHISLANYYYLLLIDKGKEKALKNQIDLNLKEELSHYQFYKTEMDAIGFTGSFPWISPDHLKPVGNASIKIIKEKLSAQLKQCGEILSTIPSGEGLACRTVINVNNLGSVDVYQYMLFLAKHTQRHLQQMENNEKEALLNLQKISG